MWAYKTLISSMFARGKTCVKEWKPKQMRKLDFYNKSEKEQRKESTAFVYPLVMWMAAYFGTSKQRHQKHVMLR